MVLEPSEVSVCLQHPGFDVDLEVSVDTATLYRVYLGRLELGGAMKAGKLAISGPRSSSAASPGGSWSAFAPASRSAGGRRSAASRLASPEQVRIGIGRDGVPAWMPPDVGSAPAAGDQPERESSHAPVVAVVALEGLA